MNCFKQVPIKTVIFILLVLGYLLWNYTDFLVWDDTAHASFNVYDNNHQYDIKQAKFYKFLIDERFGKINSDGYRPISGLIRGFGTAYFANPNASLWPFLILNSVLFACLAFLYYYFTLQFSNNSKISILSVFLFLFSTPYLTGSMVRFAGIFSLIPIHFLLIFISYFNSKESQNSIKWFSIFGFLLFISVWLRELFLIVPILLVFNEWYNKTYKSREVILSIAFLPHFIFPGAIPHILAYSELPVKSIFFMGALNKRLETNADFSFLDNILALFQDVKWRIILDCFSVFPTTIICIACLFGILSLFKDYKKNIKNPRLVFLWSFFLLTFVPLFKVFYEQLHLIYAMIPLSILISIGCTNFLLFAKRIKPVFFLVCILMFLSLLNHALNPLHVRNGTRSIYKTIFQLSEYVKMNLPLNSIVISNIHHLEDIRYYSEGHIDPWSAPGAIFNKKKWLGHTSADLEKFLKENQNRDIYFLDGKKPKVEGQLGGARAHSYANQGMVETKILGVIDRVSYVYRYLDPLRALLPVLNTEWIGPPDLEFDFYRGPALDGSILAHEIALDYNLYKVNGREVYKWAPHPQLLIENVHGFNIVGYRNRVYGIPQSEGAFDLIRVKNGGYSQVFEGNSESDVKIKINQFIKSTGNRYISKRWPIHPQLLEQNVHHFNIVGFKDKVYAIPQSEGAFDLSRIEKGGYSRIFTGDSLEKVRSDILKAN